MLNYPPSFLGHVLGQPVLDIQLWGQPIEFMILMVLALPHGKLSIREALAVSGQQLEKFD